MESMRSRCFRAAHCIRKRKTPLGQDVHKLVHSVGMMECCKGVSKADERMQCSQHVASEQAVDAGDPSIRLKVHAHSQIDKRMEVQAKMVEAMGLNEETAQQFIP